MTNDIRLAQSEADTYDAQLKCIAGVSCGSVDPQECKKYRDKELDIIRERRQGILKKYGFPWM
jgi:hypothetical protein